MLSSALKPPKVPELCSTPWLWAYCPVRLVARAGQHSGKLAKAWSKRVPWPPRSAFSCGIAGTLAAVWSSVMTTTTFGWAEANGAASAAAARTAMRTSGSFRHTRPQTPPGTPVLREARQSSQRPSPR